MKKIFIFTLMVFLFTFYSKGAFAKISRSCVGQYYLLTLYPKKNIRINLNRFNARGSCGKMKKTSCRERARDKAGKCMRAHARSLRNAYAPVECSSRSQVDNYTTSNLYNLIKDRTCRKFRGAKKVVVSLVGQTFGHGKGCPGNWVLIRELTLNCQ